MAFDLDILQQQIPQQPPEKFCLAPFISTMQTSYGKTSPCAYGVTEWQFDHLTPQQRWQATELNHMRQQFIHGATPEPCNKCINEEKAGKQSLRQRMDQWYPDAYQDLVITGRWQQGPKHVSTKVSNVCNLACRSCGGFDTNTYHREGVFYRDQYHTVNVWNEPGNRFVSRLAPRHTDYRGFQEISNNITKLEFYGGEPLLNLTHLEFLQFLVDQGRSQEITLFYSTNCTQPINPRHRRLWNHFRKIEFSLSIDHVGDKFHYLRWPGQWSEAQKNIDSLLALRDSIDAETGFVVSACCTMLNVYYIDEVLTWAQNCVGASYINMVVNPGYLAVYNAPEQVKQHLLDHVQCPEVRGFLSVREHDPIEWLRFIVWTKRQDQYRQQDFRQTFPEFYQMIQQDWDSVQDIAQDVGPM